MKEEKTKVIILHETVFQSFLNDFYTFGFIAITSWFNYNFIGGSKFVNVIILIMFMLFIFQKSVAKKFTSKEEAIKYLN